MLTFHVHIADVVQAYRHRAAVAEFAVDRQRGAEALQSRFELPQALGDHPQVAQCGGRGGPVTQVLQQRQGLLEVGLRLGGAAG